MAAGPYSSQIQLAIRNLLAGGMPFTGPALFADGTAAAPSMAFASDVTTGLFLSSGNIRISAGGSGLFQFTSGARLSILSDTAQLRFGVNQDVILTWDAANTLALRNGTAAQTFRVYNTYTDASNYERLFVGAAGGLFQIKGEIAGTGAARPILIDTNTTGILYLRSNGNGVYINSSGMMFDGDNTRDIGASGATRPRNLYVGTAGTFGGAIAIGNTVAAGIAVASTHKVTMVIGGVTYYLLASNV